MKMRWETPSLTNYRSPEDEGKNEKKASFLRPTCTGPVNLRLDQDHRDPFLLNLKAKTEEDTAAVLY